MQTQPLSFSALQKSVSSGLQLVTRRIDLVERTLVSEGRQQQKALEASLKSLSKQAGANAIKARKQLLNSLGIASQTEVAQLSKNVAALTRKLDLLLKKQPAKGK